MTLRHTAATIPSSGLKMPSGLCSKIRCKAASPMIMPTRLTTSPAASRGNEDPQPRPKRRQRRFDGARKYRHAPNQRHAAELHRHHGRRQIHAGENRRREESASDRAFGQALQQHRRREHQHAHLQNVEHFVGAELHLVAHHQRVDEEHRDDPDVLDGGYNRQRNGRDLVHAIDHGCRLFHSVPSSTKPIGAKKWRLNLDFRHGSGADDSKLSQGPGKTLLAWLPSLPRTVASFTPPGVAIWAIGR